MPALVISGQIVFNCCAIGFNTHEINLWCVLGVLLIAAGVVLVRKF